MKKYLVINKCLDKRTNVERLDLHSYYKNYENAKIKVDELNKIYKNHNKDESELFVEKFYIAVIVE